MMTARKEKFIEFYLLSGNATEAARQAGYSPGSAKVTACRLLNQPEIANTISRKRLEMESEHKVTRDRVITGLLRGIEMAEEAADAGSLISGWRELGKLMGYYAPTRSTVNVKAVNRSAFTELEKLSDAELISVIESGGSGSA